MINKALEYAEHVPIFRMQPKTAKFFPNTKGFNDATQDVEQIKAWWTDTPDANIGCKLDGTGYFVLDLDTDGHEEGLGFPAGAKALDEVRIWKHLTDESNLQYYKSKSGGLHYWFKTDSKLILEKRYLHEHKILWDYVEVLPKGAVTVPPSIVDGKEYEGNLDFESIPYVPDWLVEAIENKINGEKLLKTNYSNNYKFKGKNYTGSLLDKIVDGASEGERNVWLASVAGSLFNTGMNGYKLDDFLHVINQNYISPSLSAKEVDVIFTSIGKRFIEAGKD